MTHEDWAFHQSLQLKGYKIVTIPEPLFFYRVSSTSMIRTTQKYDNFRAQIEPFEDLDSNIHHDLCLMTELLQYTVNDKNICNKKLLPTIDDILSGAYDNCEDKVLLEFYKFTARITKMIGHVYKNKNIKSAVTKICNTIYIQFSIH